jgi:hypothetical protein
MYQIGIGRTFAEWDSFILDPHSTLKFPDKAIHNDIRCDSRLTAMNRWFNAVDCVAFTRPP